MLEEKASALEDEKRDLMEEKEKEKAKMNGSERAWRKPS